MPIDPSITALSDQSWASLREYIPDLKRIAEAGPGDDGRDRLIVQMVCFAALGRLYESSAESESA